MVIFPEGIGGVAKLFEERYRLQRFSTSAARLAWKHRVPVIPFAVVGAEEAYPVIGRSEEAGAALGAPYLPITPFFPAARTARRAAPADQVEPRVRRAASRCTARGAFATRPDFEAMTERLRRSVGVLIERGLCERESVFLG